LNKFADLTSQEFKNSYHGYKHLKEPTNHKTLKELGMPDKLDWRELGAVTRVKD
jgi:hypothetical protein